MHALYLARTQRKEDVLFTGSSMKKDTATQTPLAYQTRLVRTRLALFSHLPGHHMLIQSTLHFVESHPWRFFSHKTPRARSAALRLYNKLMIIVTLLI